MALFRLAALAPGKESALADCPAIGLGDASGATLTVQCSYEAHTEGPLRVHVRSSVDGLHYDTTDGAAFDVEVCGESACQKTVTLPAQMRFLKVIVSNPSSRHNVSNIIVTATIIG
jgi:hypothetical protein